MPKKGRFLEIGCGIGTQTKLMLQYLSLDANVTAIDISEKSIEIAKKRLKKYENLELISGDIIEIDIGGIYDVIVLPDVIEHIPLAQHRTLFDKLSKLLKKEGFILIHIPSPYYLEWATQYKKEDLQVIDQPVHTLELLKNLDNTNLYVHYLNTYSIFNNPEDYQIIVLKQKQNSTYQPVNIPINDSLIRRINRKLKYYIRGAK